MLLRTGRRCAVLGTDLRSIVPGERLRLELKSNDAIGDIDNRLAIVQIGSGEKRVLRHAELPAGFDKVRNVFHLFEGHLGLVDAPDRIRGNGVDSIAQDDTDS